MIFRDCFVLLLQKLVSVFQELLVLRKVRNLLLQEKNFLAMLGFELLKLSSETRDFLELPLLINSRSQAFSNLLQL